MSFICFTKFISFFWGQEREIAMLSLGSDEIKWHCTLSSLLLPEPLQCVFGVLQEKKQITWKPSSDKIQWLSDRSWLRTTHFFNNWDLGSRQRWDCSAVNGLTEGWSQCRGGWVYVREGRVWAASPVRHSLLFGGSSDGVEVSPTVHSWPLLPHPLEVSAHPAWANSAQGPQRAALPCSFPPLLSRALSWIPAQDLTPSMLPLCREDCTSILAHHRFSHGKNCLTLPSQLTAFSSSSLNFLSSRFPQGHLLRVGVAQRDMT